MRKTISGMLGTVGARANGRAATPSLDIVIDGRTILDIRPTGLAAPEGEVIDLKGKDGDRGLD